METASVVAGGVGERAVGPARVGWAAMVVIGLVAGAAARMNMLAAGEAGWIGGGRVAMNLCAFALIGLAGVLALHWATARLVRKLDPDVRARYWRRDWLTYSPALLVLLGAVGVHFPPILVVLLLVIAAKAAALYSAMPRAARSEVFSSMGWLAFLFLISGFAALIYQIVWQRTLFAAFGVNIESITIVVSLFMFGLGLGSMVGGLLARRFPNSAAVLFLTCELGIGLFGVVSLPLIEAVARATLHGTLLQVSLAIFGLLVIPTMLMGATLPILVGHLYRHYHNVGKSVGLLYCINTVGSAIACFLTADLLFVVTGQQGAVLVAAGCNLVVGVLVWRYVRRVGSRQSAVGSGEDCELRIADCGLGERVNPQSEIRNPQFLRRLFVLFFAAASGYISLSQEMLWMRLVSYMTGGQPAVFAHVLGFFLVGVALGSLYAEHLCATRFREGAGAAHGPVRYVGGMLIGSAVFYYLSIIAMAWLHRHWPDIGIGATHVIVAVVSFLVGGIFPVLCHYGARAGQSVGLAVSRLYVANIVGSTLGPLLTGFVLMDRFGTDQIIALITIATLALGAIAFFFDVGGRRVAWAAAAGLLIVGVWVGHERLYRNLLQQFHFQNEIAGQPYNHLIENRSGIIATAESDDGDKIYGGGMYDGTFNTDPLVDSNHIRRAYMIAGLHPEPREVLEIGLSSASWTRVVANYKAVQKITVVEINPGYLDIIKSYPEQASVLNDPKVTIHIDDGRRWLNRNPEAKFDFILQNTTWHWRSHITNLVSEEYLRLCKQHLKPGGVMYYNTTWSPDISYTAARVFKHVTTYWNFVAASDSPFALSPAEISKNLCKFVDRDGKQVFSMNNMVFYDKLLKQMAAAPLKDIGDELRATTDRRLITDDNMATEYKRQPWYSPRWAWWEYFGLGK